MTREDDEARDYVERRVERALARQAAHALETELERQRAEARLSRRAFFVLLAALLLGLATIAVVLLF